MISQAQQKFFAWLIDPKRVTAKGPPPKDGPPQGPRDKETTAKGPPKKGEACSFAEPRMEKSRT